MVAKLQHDILFVLKIEVYCTGTVFYLCRNPAHGDIFVATLYVEVHSGLEDATSHLGCIAFFSFYDTHTL
jgi:hypothetical protein